MSDECQDCGEHALDCLCNLILCDCCGKRLHKKHSEENSCINLCFKCKRRLL